MCEASLHLAQNALERKEKTNMVPLPKGRLSVVGHLLCIHPTLLSSE